MNKSIYIAGPMTGIDDLGRTAFNAAESYLSYKGWTVINPACLPIGLKPTAYMPICLAMLDAADVVCMLKGWETSKGACLEYHYAKAQGKTVYDGLEAVLEIKEDV